MKKGGRQTYIHFYMKRLVCSMCKACGWKGGGMWHPRVKKKHKKRWEEGLESRDVQLPKPFTLLRKCETHLSGRPRRTNRCVVSPLPLPLPLVHPGLQGKRHSPLSTPRTCNTTPLPSPYPPFFSRHGPLAHRFLLLLRTHSMQVQPAPLRPSWPRLAFLPWPKTRASSSAWTLEQWRMALPPPTTPRACRRGTWTSPPASSPKVSECSGLEEIDCTHSRSPMHRLTPRTPHAYSHTVRSPTSSTASSSDGEKENYLAKAKRGHKKVCSFDPNHPGTPD